MKKATTILFLIVSIYSNCQVLNLNNHPSGATMQSRMIYAGIGFAENYLIYTITYNITEKDNLSKYVAFGATFLTSYLIADNTCHFAAMGILGNGISGMVCTPKIIIKLPDIYLFKKKNVILHKKRPKNNL